MTKGRVIVARTGCQGRVTADLSTAYAPVEMTKGTVIVARTAGNVKGWANRSSLPGYPLRSKISRSLQALRGGNENGVLFSSYSPSMPSAFPLSSRPELRRSAVERSAFSGTFLEMFSELRYPTARNRDVGYPGMGLAAETG